jgi:hypothetical protein
MSTAFKLVAAIAIALAATPALAKPQSQAEMSHAPVATNSTFNTAYTHGLSTSRDPADRLGPSGVLARD